MRSVHKTVSQSLKTTKQSEKHDITQHTPSVTRYMTLTHILAVPKP